jgi:16S rRNA (uracil1498-N3)-methyltransferase
MAERFYTSLPLRAGPFLLQGPEAHHLATVCRAKVGQRITLFNGDGKDYPACIVAIARKAVELDVGPGVESGCELAQPLTIACAPPKGDRLDFLLEKLTELGVSRWVPLVCERGVVDARKLNHDRLQRAVVEAAKQCGRSVLMQIEPARTCAEWLSQPCAEPTSRVLAHSEPSVPRQRLAEVPRGRAVLAAIGPEGGFTPAEVRAAQEAGWHIVTLGPRVLRVETAALLLAAWAGWDG